MVTDLKELLLVCAVGLVVAVIMFNLLGRTLQWWADQQAEREEENDAD